jgi:hypothetical protein
MAGEAARALRRSHDGRDASHRRSRGISACGDALAVIHGAADGRRYPDVRRRGRMPRISGVVIRLVNAPRRARLVLSVQVGAPFPCRGVHQHRRAVYAHARDVFHAVTLGATLVHNLHSPRVRASTLPSLRFVPVLHPVVPLEAGQPIVGSGRLPARHAPHAPRPRLSASRRTAGARPGASCAASGRGPPTRVRVPPLPNPVRRRTRAHRRTAAPATPAQGGGGAAAQ